MRILVENLLTHKVLGADGLWHRRAASAKAFKTSVEALDFYQARHLEGTEIVLSFDFGSIRNIKVLVSERCRKGRAPTRL